VGLEPTTGGLERDVGVGPVQVTGQIISSGRTVAWCHGCAGPLPSPNKVADPRSFATALAEDARVTVPWSAMDWRTAPRVPSRSSWSGPPRPLWRPGRSQQVRDFRGQELVALDRAGPGR